MRITLSLLVDLRINEQIRYRLKIYSVTGDYLALRLILRFISHGGYYCCWFCYVRGEHVNCKRQYRYESSMKIRTSNNYAAESRAAQQQQVNIHGHLGISILEGIVDIPLPMSIIPDYLHISLLGHGKALLLKLYSHLKPEERMKIDIAFKEQPFPHFFHRKMKSIGNLGHVKATEVKNILFYGLLPHIQQFISTEKSSHLALYICFLRILHVQPMYGLDASELANRLFIEYYRDIDIYYDGLQNFVLHLHRHLPDVYRMHGSLSNIGCFGQDDFIGNIGSNHHGTRFYGELLTFYYNVDYALQSKKKTSHVVDGPLDVIEQICYQYKQLHEAFCSCENINGCLSIYKRCIINRNIFHSLLYMKRGRSTSYFVQYRDEQNHFKFGTIKLFFQIASSRITYVLIDRYDVIMKYSSYFKQSKYYHLILCCRIILLLKKFSNSIE